MFINPNWGGYCVSLRDDTLIRPEFKEAEDETRDDAFYDKGYRYYLYWNLDGTSVKCLAEDVLGISTIRGLGKHSANKIMGAFGENRTINEAIEHLEQKPSYQKTESWKAFTQEKYEKHIPRWEHEREAAIKWLKEYKETHWF